MRHIYIRGMALPKAEYLAIFCRQENAVVRHLVKIFCIYDSQNYRHWVKEINIIFERLMGIKSKSSVKESELKKAFVFYDVDDGWDWRVLYGYCDDYNNFTKDAYIYTSGLEPCKYIRAILTEFLELLVSKKKDIIKVEELPSFKTALSKRSKTHKYVTLKEVLKVKNNIWN